MSHALKCSFWTTCKLSKPLTLRSGGRGLVGAGADWPAWTICSAGTGAATDVQVTLGRAAKLLPSAKRSSAAERCCSQLTKRANKAELTSFIETVLQLVVCAHVCASAIQPVFLVELPVVQLVVELVGGGVE